jgi:hypothetical protein
MFGSHLGEAKITCYASRESKIMNIFLIKNFLTRMFIVKKRGPQD